jgi:putative transposase
MGRKASFNNLSPSDLDRVQEILRVGSHPVWVINRARVLLMNHEGQTLKSISALLGINYVVATGVIRDYKSEGLSCALYDLPRSGAPVKLTEQVEANITAIACSEAPEGHVSWTVEMIRDELIRLKVVEQLSIGSTHTVLKKVNLNRGNTNFGASKP